MTLYRPKYLVHGELTESAVWWTRFQCHGRRIRKSTGCRDKRAAEIEQARIMQQAELEAVVPGLKARSLPLPNLVDQYLGELVRLNRADKTLKTRDHRLRHMTSGLTSVRDVTPEEIRKRLYDLAMEGKGPNTVNGYRGALYAFFSWLIREGLWEDNPCMRVGRLDELDPDIRGVFTPTEIDRLVEVAPPHRAAVYLVAVTTGLRRAELQRLTWQNVDLDHSVIRFPAGKAKAKRFTLLPLLPHVVRALRVLGPCGPHEKVFVTRKGKSGVPTMRTFKEDLKKAGILETDSTGKRDFHSLRASLQTALAEAGVPLTVAQKILRHSDPRLTANRYTNHATRVKADALAQVWPCQGPCQDDDVSDDFSALENLEIQDPASPPEEPN